MLTDKQAEFVRQFALTGNATQSAISAGYSERTSYQKGHQLRYQFTREIEEETGLTVSVGPVVEVFDRILFDDDGRVEYHFVLVDFLCRATGGTLAPRSDVTDAVLANPETLNDYGLTKKAEEVIAQAVVMRRTWRGG